MARRWARTLLLLLLVADVGDAGKVQAAYCIHTCIPRSRTAAYILRAMVLVVPWWYLGLQCKAGTVDAGLQASYCAVDSALERSSDTAQQ